MRHFQIGIILSLCMILLGCQHSPISFTDSQPPSVPQFTPLERAPSFDSFSAHTSKLNNIAPISRQVSKVFTTYEWPESGTVQSHRALNAVYFIGISPSASLKSPDVLIEAFSQLRKTLANQSHSAVLSACYDSIRFRASLHSIAISMQCSSPISEMQAIIWRFWSTGSLDTINIETVQRNLKLNKHIGAFTGSEIDKVFRSQLLGDQHPYNLNIDNQELVNELVGSNQLQQLQRATRDNMQWHLFTTTSASSNNEQIPLTLEKKWPAWLMQQPTPSTDVVLNTQQEPKDNLASTLFLIDAPDTVQTQIRVGFVTAKNEQIGLANQLKNTTETNLDSTIGCKTIAPLLGRSYSGRLFYDLRETRGLTYGIYGRCIDAPLSQYFYFYGSTALENTGAFLKGIIDHTQLLIQQKVSQAEIDAVATYLIGQRQLALDVSFGKENAYIRHVLSGKTAEQADQQMKLMSQLTPEQLLQISINTLSSQPTIVLRGDADKITQDIGEKLPNWQIKIISAN